MPIRTIHSGGQNHKKYLKKFWPVVERTINSPLGDVENRKIIFDFFVQKKQIKFSELFGVFEHSKFFSGDNFPIREIVPTREIENPEAWVGD